MNTNDANKVDGEKLDKQYLVALVALQAFNVLLQIIAWTMIYCDYVQLHKN